MLVQLVMAAIPNKPLLSTFLSRVRLLTRDIDITILSVGLTVCRLAVLY